MQKEVVSSTSFNIEEEKDMNKINEAVRYKNVIQSGGWGFLNDSIKHQVVITSLPILS